MSPALVALGALLGLIAGSFLGAVSTRWPVGESVAQGRSRCDACMTPLGALDLVPVLSFLWLRGRCRHCGAAIPARNLAIELGAGMIGLVAFAAHPWPLALVTASLGWWLLLIALLDLDHQWLPDRLTLPLAAAGLAVSALAFGPPLIDRAIGAAVGYLALLLIAVAYRVVRGREGLGGGDPKLLGALGAWLGWPQLPFVLVGAGTLGLAALLLRRLRGEKIAADDRLPLGTLMALAGWPIWLVVAA